MERVSLDHDDIVHPISFYRIIVDLRDTRSVSGTRREKQAIFKRNAGISIRVEKTDRAAILHNLRTIQHRQLRLIF